MIAIILEILGILLRIFLVILAVVLVSLLLILFVPICYRAEGAFYKEEKHFRVRVSWFGILLRGRYAFPGREPVVKALWIQLYPKKEKKPKPKAKRKRETVRSAETDEKSTETAEASMGTAEASIRTAKEPIETDTKPLADTVNAEEESEAEAENAGPDEKEFSRKSPKPSIRERIQEIYERIILKIRSCFKKIRNIINSAEHYLNLLEEEDTQILIGQGKKLLGWTWKNVRPRVLRVKGVFGTGSPDTTGYLYGLYCMALPMLGRHVELSPDFDNRTMEGECRIRGHVTIFVIVIIALRVVLNKRFWNLIKKWNREEL